MNDNYYGNEITAVKTENNRENKNPYKTYVEGYFEELTKQRFEPSVLTDFLLVVDWLMDKVDITVRLLDNDKTRATAVNKLIEIMGATNRIKLTSLMWAVEEYLRER